MIKDQSVRQFPFSDADLKQQADRLLLNLNRDLGELGQRNIDADRLKPLSDLIDAFDATDRDEELSGALSDAVLRKDAKVENLLQAIRHIRNMADVQYNGEGKYKIFGFDNMSRLSDNELYRMAKSVLRVGRALQSELSTQGLSAGQLNNLEQQILELDTAIDEVAQAKAERDLHTQDRVQKANALWKEMSKFASIGRSVYADTNEAKYNDYVLIPSSTPTPETTAQPNTTPAG